jgi:hypothetical protein
MSVICLVLNGVLLVLKVVPIFVFLNYSYFVTVLVSGPYYVKVICIPVVVFCEIFGLIY